MERQNSAARLADVLRAMPSISDQEKAYKGWALVFGLKGEGENHEVAKPVAERLVWANRELRLLEALLQTSSLSERLYASTIQNVSRAFSPVLLGSQWVHVKQYVTEAHRVAFDHWAELLPIEELDVTTEQLEELRRLVSEMLAAVEISPALPAQLENLVRHHAEMILSALDEYRIAGSRAIKNVMYIAAGEIGECADEFKREKDSKAIRALIKAWGAAAKVVDAASKVERAVRLVSDIYRWLEK